MEFDSELELSFLGSVGKPHGLRGSFYVGSRSSLWPEGVVNVFLQKPPQDDEAPSPPIASRVTSHAVHAERSVIKLENLSTRNAIEEFRGYRLFAKKADLGESSLIGLKVVAECESGVIGEVITVENYGASDILTIHHAERGYLDIPAPYFGKPSGDLLPLLVSSEVFEEFWYVDEN